MQELKEVSRSYKEANMALEVGRVFYGERGVLAYNELGIGRLVHQLPRSLCEMFLKEVLAVNATEMFDDEEPVSYTHLDVYKRQPHRNRRFLTLMHKFWQESCNGSL